MRRLLSAAALLVASAASAQPPPVSVLPRVNSVFPAGAKAGTSVEVTALGTDLDEPAGLLFSHAGITAEVIAPSEVPPPKDAKKDPKKDVAPKGMKAVGKPTEAKFKVSVAAAVPPGSYDVRVIGKQGISTPRFFVVGTLPEVNETEPNNDIPEAQRVGIGSVVNGVIANGTDVDYFVFAGKKGQRLLLHCAAGSIDSRARPNIELYAGDGRTRLANNRNYHGSDALVDATLPGDGDYYIRLSEFAYQTASSDSFYRLTIRTGPWIDAIYPPMIVPGAAATVTVYGRNLPNGVPVPGQTIDGRPVENLQISLTYPKETTTLDLRSLVPPTAGLLDGFEYRINEGNALPVYRATAPVILETDANNDDPAHAQQVTTPCEIAGRIEKRYDRDWYTFPLKKGEVRMIELFADRIGPGLDSYLSLRDAATGKDLTAEGQLDDDLEPLHPAGFYSRHADPAAYKFTAPADGTYQVMVGSRESNISFGPRCVYRLRIAPPTPDFRAVVMTRSRDLPAAPTVRPEGATALDVFVARMDGFNGPVTFMAANLPAGVTALPATVGTGQKWGTLLLIGAADLSDALTIARVTATGTIHGTPTTRTARPATMTWGIPNAGNNPPPMLTRLDQSFPVAARSGEKPPFRIAADLASATVKGADGKEEKVKSPVVLRPGDKLALPVKVLWSSAEARANPVTVALEPTQPNMQQNGIGMPNNNQGLTIAKEKNDGPLTLDVRPNAAPGVYAIALRGETSAKTGKDKRDGLLIAHAAPFDVLILPASLGKFTAQTPPLKKGQTATVTVRVERLFDFDGEFAVKLNFPKDSGLSADAAILAAGTSETKVPVTAAKDAKEGAISGATLQAVAVYDGKYGVPHEVKLAVSVVK